MKAWKDNNMLLREGGVSKKISSKVDRLFGYLDKHSHKWPEIYEYYYDGLENSLSDKWRDTLDWIDEPSEGLKVALSRRLKYKGEFVPMSYFAIPKIELYLPNNSEDYYGNGKLNKLSQEVINKFISKIKEDSDRFIFLDNAETEGIIEFCLESEDFLDKTLEWFDKYYSEFESLWKRFLGYKRLDKDAVMEDALWY